MLGFPVRAPLVDHVTTALSPPALARAGRVVAAVLAASTLTVSTVSAMSAAGAFESPPASNTSTSSAADVGSAPPVRDVALGRPVADRPTGVAATAWPAVPAASGTGKRVVFDQSDQRVWLVGDDDRAVRSYLVSGSRFDQLRPGSYKVYSTSSTATSWDGQSTMRDMVRFTRGSRAAIGFHDIPRSGGAPVQTEAQLGTRLSDGCIRQAPDDAQALWDFAPVGTPVVVVA